MVSETDSSAMMHRVTKWKLPTSVLTIKRLPLLMGIINVTPDSFSDGGKYASVEDAVERGLKLVAEGADILDIGGESTRPYATPVDEQEELRRVVPVVARLSEATSIPISIDTSKARVAREAVAAGAQIINDVTGLNGDSGMTAVALETQAALCAMHMQGTPQTMQDCPMYDDVVEDILKYLRQRRSSLTDAGIDPLRICLDPGIGFGKTHQHNLTLLANCHRFHELACPLLVGPSRKGFLGKVLNDGSADRLPGTIGVVLSLARQGVQIIRVHDVAPVRQALLLYDAAGGIDGRELTLPKG